MGIALIFKYYVCYRLEAYDRNHNFGATDDPCGAEYQMQLPSATDYRDLHADR
jgi:hypothetical protein